MWQVIWLNKQISKVALSQGVTWGQELLLDLVQEGLMTDTWK